MSAKQEQRDEQRRLAQEAIKCWQLTPPHARVDPVTGRMPLALKMGEVCRHCQEPATDPLLAMVPAQDRPRMCAENGGHEVAPARWPPTNKHSSSKRAPALNARCRRCRANVICYDPLDDPTTKVYDPTWKRVIAGGAAELVKA